jgi:hypothetical protein
MADISVSAITFSSNGSDESLKALTDMWSRFSKVQNITYNYLITDHEKAWVNSLSDCHFSLYALHRLGFGIEFPNAVFRGNVVKFGQICLVDDHYKFDIEVHDAWEPNVNMFDIIIRQFYGDKIKMEYITGMSRDDESGILTTNCFDLVDLTRVKVFAEGIDNVLQFHNCWDYSNNPLFPSIDNPNVYHIPGHWQTRRIGHNINPVYYPPNLEYDDILIYDSRNAVPFYMKCIDNIPGELYCRIDSVSYTSPKSQYGYYAEAEPIYDNFTTFGGNNNG